MPSLFFCCVNAFDRTSEMINWMHFTHYLSLSSALVMLSRPAESQAAHFFADSVGWRVVARRLEQGLVESGGWAEQFFTQWDVQATSYVHHSSVRQNVRNVSQV